MIIINISSYHDDDDDDGFNEFHQTKPKNIMFLIFNVTS